MRQDGQFLGRVGAIHVHCRVRFRIAPPLGLGHCRRVVGILLIHLSEDEVARPIQDRVDRLDLVGLERLADGRDNRNAAPDGSLEGNGSAQLPRPIEQFPPVFRQTRLVGGHHVLAALQKLQDDGPGRFEPPDQFHRGHDLRIVEHRTEIVGKKTGRQGDVSWSRQILVDDPGQRNPSPRMPAYPIATLQKEFCHPRSDRSESNYRNLGGIHCNQCCGNNLSIRLS